MKENGFKPIKKWFLMSCLMLTPLAYANAISEDFVNNNLKLNITENLSMDSGLHRKEASANHAIESALKVELINETVFFHDYSYALLLSFPAEFAGTNYNLLKENIANVTATLNKINATFSAQLSILLTNYFNAGVNYVLILNSTSNQNDPGVNAAFKTWIANANLIAAFLKQSNPEINLQNAQTILIAYTNFLAATALNLIPTTTINPNLVGASTLYSETRKIAADALSLLFLEAATPIVECHHHHHR